ncbi:MAG: hypothetical protein ACE367_25330 [Acidimicrobiales bacterium]
MKRADEMYKYVAGSDAGRLFEIALRAPDTVAAVARARAVELGSQSTMAARTLMLDTIRLRTEAPADLAPLTDSERAWWIALRASGDGAAEACRLALASLPHDRYGSRHVLFLRFDWAKLGAADREQLLRDTESPTEVGEFELARLALRFRLGDRSSPELLAEVGSAAKDAGLRVQPVPGRPDLVPASQVALEAVRSGASVTLAAHDHLLSDDLFDDLVDDGQLDVREVPADLSDYRRARVAIWSVADAGLAELDARREIFRRRLAAHKPLPKDMPEEVLAEFSLCLALREGDMAQLSGLLRQRGDEVLADVIEARDHVPSEEALQDPSVFRSMIDIVDPDWRALSPEQLGITQRRWCAVAILRQARTALWSWQWSDALDLAIQALRISAAEVHKDEALNLIAAAHWQLGNADAAATALSKALEGEYTQSLVVNMAALAGMLDQEEAAKRLAQLVNEAPDLTMRVAAAHRAVSIWLTSDEPWANQDELPPRLRDALRSLVVQNLGIEDFGQIAHLLAARDSDWMADPRSLAGSPHRQSTEARVWVARATGFEEFIRELRDALRRSPAPWVERERDALVEAARAAVITEDPDIGAVGFGMLLLQEGLPMSPEDLTVLRAFVARAVAMNIDPDEGEPSEIFIDWLERALRDLRQVPADLRDSAELAVRMGARALAGSILLARHGTWQQVAEMHDAMVDRLAGLPRRSVNLAAVREVAKPGVEFCDDTIKTIDRLRVLVDDGELLDALASLRSMCRDLRSSFHRMTT